MLQYTAIPIHMRKISIQIDPSAVINELVQNDLASNIKKTLKEVPISKCPLNGDGVFS